MAAASAGMAVDLGSIVEQVAAEKGIDKKVLIETMEAAILKAAQAVFGPTRELEARFNEESGNIDLFQYIRHLEANSQTSQRYEIEFWRKVFYPLSCMVMVVLALPFAYLHFRSGGITAYVFGGVLIGISFFLLNNVFGYIGNLRNWVPWLTSAAPGILYSLLSLGAFGWLVLRR